MRVEGLQRGREPLGHELRLQHEPASVAVRHGSSDEPGTSLRILQYQRAVAPCQQVVGVSKGGVHRTHFFSREELASLAQAMLQQGGLP